MTTSANFSETKLREPVGAKMNMSRFGYEGIPKPLREAMLVMFQEAEKAGWAFEAIPESTIAPSLKLPSFSASSRRRTKRVRASAVLSDLLEKIDEVTCQWAPDVDDTTGPKVLLLAPLSYLAKRGPLPPDSPVPRRRKRRGSTCIKDGRFQQKRPSQQPATVPPQPQSKTK